MKKSLGFSALALATLFAVGCGQEATQVTSAQEEQIQEEQVSNVPLRKVTITVGDTETKTQLADGNAVYWNAGDAIDVYVDGSKYTLTNSNKEASANATFTGELPEGELTVYAIYPSGAASACANGVFTATIPTEQDAVTDLAVEGGLSKNVSVATGTVDDAGEGSLYFMNACSILKFKVADNETTGQKASKATSVVIKAAGEDAPVISGELSIDATNAVKKDGSVATETSGASYVKVNAPENGFSTSDTYYVWVAPASLSDGYIVEYEYRADNATEIPMMAQVVEASTEFARASIKDLGTATPTEAYYQFALVDNAGSYATFAAGNSYAIAYPNPEDASQYGLFSFDNYVEAASASEAVSTVSGVTKSSDGNWTKIKPAIYQVFRTDGIVGDYELSNNVNAYYSSGDISTGAHYISVLSDIQAEVSFSTKETAIPNASSLDKFSSTIDKDSKIYGTFGTSTTLDIYGLTATLQDDNTAVLGGMPNPTSMLALYKSVVGREPVITWGTFTSSSDQNFSFSWKWNLLMSAISSHKMTSYYNTELNSGYYTGNSSNFGYMGAQALLITNFVWDMANGKGIVPVVTFDIQTLGVYSKAGSLSYWGSDQMRAVDNNWNNAKGTGQYNSDDTVWGGTSLLGASCYTAAGSTYRYPVYNFTNSKRIYLYKNTGKYVGVE